MKAVGDTSKTAMAEQIMETCKLQMLHIGIIIKNQNYQVVKHVETILKQLFTILKTYTTNITTGKKPDLLMDVVVGEIPLHGHHLKKSL